MVFEIILNIIDILLITTQGHLLKDSCKRTSTECLTYCLIVTSSGVNAVYGIFLVIFRALHKCKYRDDSIFHHLSLSATLSGLLKPPTVFYSNLYFKPLTLVKLFVVEVKEVLLGDDTSADDETSAEEILEEG